MDDVSISLTDKDGDFLEVESRKPGLYLSPCAFLRTSEGGFWVGDGNTEDEVFSALLSVVRRYNPDYCPPGFVPIGGADQARTDMQQVSDGDSPLRSNGQLAKQPGPAVGPGHYTALLPQPHQVIQCWGLENNWQMANAIKYIGRAPYKGNHDKDVLKAIWMLADRIGERELRDQAQRLQEKH